MKKHVLTLGMGGYAGPRTALLIVLLLAGCRCACAADLVDSFGGMTTVIYGIAAGVAALMIAFHAIRYKASAGAGERDAARRSIVNVIFGLILIMLAATAVHLLYYPENAGPQPPARNYTIRFATTHTHPTISTTSTGPGTTTSTNCAPAYDPTRWNTLAVRPNNNCYNYGCDKRTDTFAQPGRASGVSITNTCSSVIAGAKEDGLAYLGVSGSSCSGCTHKVALVVDPRSPGDFHWYRLDDGNYWSHKPGQMQVTDRDASGNRITKVETANRNYGTPNYVQVCGYFCVDKTKINIR